LSGSPDLKYLAVSGYYSRAPTPLIPKMETFGASFFEWDQGNSARIILFLQTLGYNDLQVAPLDKRFQLVGVEKNMPNWPETGSVRIIGDLVFIKFGPYSDTQRDIICDSISTKIQEMVVDGFCE
jgi:hypothetical protein